MSAAEAMWWELYDFALSRGETVPLAMRYAWWAIDTGQAPYLVTNIRTMNTYGDLSFGYL